MQIREWCLMSHLHRLWSSAVALGTTMGGVSGAPLGTYHFDYVLIILQRGSSSLILNLRNEN